MKNGGGNKMNGMNRQKGGDLAFGLIEMMGKKRRNIQSGHML
jgi:hypothetical protein